MGHQTSIALEPEFWEELSKIAVLNKVSLAGLISKIDENRTNQKLPHSLASCLRLYVLKYLKNKEIM